MESDKHIGKNNVLVVARWPLGGIRTYMRYVYKHLTPRYNITIIASSTQEDNALTRDCAESGARLIISKANGKYGWLYKDVFTELMKKKYSLIHSHGLISAVHVSIANLFFNVPHMLTTHGVLEKKYFASKLGFLKRYTISRIMKNVDVLYAVSQDILDHLKESVPTLDSAKCRQVVINNGVDTLKLSDGERGNDLFRDNMGISDDTFLIGFLGRFMEEKGLNYLIEAIAEIEHSQSIQKKYKVLAVGSGDYEKRYRKMVKNEGLENKFVFLPFQSDVASILRSLNVVVVPSIWEAYPLLPMEAMCVGTPVIASNCIGLREVVRNTPALVFENKDSKSLAEKIVEVVESDELNEFIEFIPAARERYDVRNVSDSLQDLYDNIIVT